MNKLNRALALIAGAIGVGVVGIFAVAPRTPPAAPGPMQGEKFSKWDYGAEVDEMRRVARRTARLQADRPIETRWGSEAVWLTVLADDDSSVLITSEALATCGRTTIVAFRIDDGSVEHAQCVHSDVSQARGTAWLMPFGINPASGMPIPPRLKVAHRMIVEVPTLDGPVQVSFNVEGLEI